MLAGRPWSYQYKYGTGTRESGICKYEPGTKNIQDYLLVNCRVKSQETTLPVVAGLSAHGCILEEKPLRP